MMVTMTVNIDEGVSRRFRRFAKAKYGARKGSLGKAVKDAFVGEMNKDSKKFQKSIDFLASCREKARSYAGKPSKPFSREEIYADLLR
ncbi:hypothetical protein HY993_02270 [Candidatus Micrarchaeota archaeon]|nr:hypothetical protein [Candidatus Micrarchaeota archaeon]